MCSMGHENECLCASQHPNHLWNAYDKVNTYEHCFLAMVQLDLQCRNELRKPQCLVYLHHIGYFVWVLFSSNLINMYWLRTVEVVQTLHNFIEGRKCSSRHFCYLLCGCGYCWIPKLSLYEIWRT